MNRPKKPFTPPVPFIIQRKSLVVTPLAPIPSIAPGSASNGKLPANSTLPNFSNSTNNKLKNHKMVIQPLMTVLRQGLAHGRRSHISSASNFLMSNHRITSSQRRNLSGVAHNWMGKAEGIIDTDHAKFGHLKKNKSGKPFGITGLHLANQPDLTIADVELKDPLGIRVGSVTATRPEGIFTKKYSTFFPDWFANLSEQCQLDLYLTAYRFSMFDTLNQTKVGIIRYGGHKIPVAFKVDGAGNISPYPIHERDYIQYGAKIIFRKE